MKGFLLKQSPFKDSGVLIKCFTEELGVMSCIAKNARKQGGRNKSILDLFGCYDFELSGKSQLKSIKNYELDAKYRLKNLNVYAGLYLNELILKCIPEYAPVPDLFFIYQKSIAQLEKSIDHQSLSNTVRQFECAILNEQGFYPCLTEDSDQNKLEQKYYYLLKPGYLAQKLESKFNSPFCYLGEDLMNSDQNYFNDLTGKKIIAQWLFECSGHKNFKTRSILKKLF